MGDVLQGKFNRDETPGKKQDTLRRVDHPAGMGTPWNPSGRVGGGSKSKDVPTSLLKLRPLRDPNPQTNGS